jgi:hypothetical protein
MKTPAQIIAELDRNGETWGGAFLIVAFPTTTSVVPDTSPDRLQLLEDLLRQGGIPIGTFGVETVEGEKHVLCLFLKERGAIEEWVPPYVRAFARKFLTADSWHSLTFPVGIDEFRRPGTQTNRGQRP